MEESFFVVVSGVQVLNLIYIMCYLYQLS